jgi:hypothetical protein
LRQGRIDVEKKEEKVKKDTGSEREGYKYKLPTDFCEREGVSNIGETTFHLDSHTVSTGKSNCSELRFS